MFLPAHHNDYIFRVKRLPQRDVYYVPQALKQPCCKIYFGMCFSVIIWFKDFWTCEVTWFSLRRVPWLRFAICFLVCKPG